MGRQDYRVFAPAPGLRDVVRCLWTFQSEGPDTQPQRIAPDGCPELIIHLASPYFEWVDKGLVEQPPILFAGQITRPLALEARAGVSVLGVRFEPDGAHRFLGAPMRMATDRRIDLLACHGKEAARALESVRRAGSFEAQRRGVEFYVTEMLGASGVRLSPVVRAALIALREMRPLREITSGYSERKIQRLFGDWVGVPPRTMAAIFRFRRVFDAIETPAKPRWVESALAAGYFDQPQMARDFRRFLGCTARDWAVQRIGLARALVRPAPVPD